MAERDMANRKKSNMTRVLFVVLLIVGFYMLLRSINF
jgi:hypothetical protein